MSSPLQDLTPPAPPAELAAPSTLCGHCRKEAPKKNTCTKCLRVRYCGAECQREDWKFHKRICEKPKAPAAAAPAAPPQEPAAAGGASSATSTSGGSSSSSSSSSTTSSSGSSSSSSSSALASSSSKNTEVVRDEDLDEEDRAALAAVKKTGYRVHWRKAEEEAAIRSAIGDIAPKRIEASAAGAAAAAASAPALVPSGGGGGGGGASATSAWNSAGTMEQRHMRDWFFERLRGLLGALPPAGALRCTGEVAGLGDSTADILMARGKTKHVYDLRFSVVVEHAGEGAAAAKTPLHLTFLDVSNDTAGDRQFKVEFLEGCKLAEAAQDAVKGSLRAGGAAAALVAGVVRAVEDAVAAFMAL